ncbi:hypothetical protein BIY21_16560 [Vibrio ponticus]|uniref:Probable membrane transporter protein n=1 Tax=Vibrio ponticus TaxID=265668 RepID=A0ABX3FEB2_9VIBR|nr:sulfite exporter TauE/SafE family protein [Vibrio ponticus]OLQ87845.1 hypothetical protein BIY21_16560 [Vibrio ponticus]
MDALFITDPWFYCTAIPAILIFGIGKGGLGGALGIVAVPLMSLTIAPVQAAAIMLPILLLMDAFAVKHHYRSIDWQIVKQMLPGMVIGVAAAGMFMLSFSEALIRVGIGLLCLYFSARYFLSYRRRDEENAHLMATPWGFLSGFASTAIHAGGGPASIYFLSLKIDKVVLIASMAAFFALTNVCKLVPFYLLGELEIANMATALLLMPIAPIGVKMGVWLLHRCSNETVYTLCYSLLVLSGSNLFIDGVAAL